MLKLYVLAMKMSVILLVAVAVVRASAAPVRPGMHKPKPATIVLQGHRRPASRSDALQQEKAGHAGKTNVRRVMVTTMVHGRLVRVSRVVRVRAVPVVPAHPEPERLKEIQKALAEKGYFKGEPNGEWNAESVAALKQFQTDRSLAADGKISALSLIGLGLGPKRDSNAPVPTAVKTDQTNPQ
jgi:putative peptidoglycan binding protein